MTWIKICGMTNLEDALVAVDAGADAVGFVFYEKSPRNVSVETAREIVERLPKSVEKVGVFVSESLERISSLTNAVRLTTVQIYPSFRNSDSLPNDKFLANVPCPLIVALSASQLIDGNSDDPDKITGFRVSQGLANKVCGVLVDSGHSDRPGGTGETFEWSIVAPMVEVIRRAGLRLLVAGGLTGQNVTAAISVLKPWGVDVASGVEASPGKKDPEKVRAFVRAVREYDRKVG